MISSPRPSALRVRGFTIIVRLRQARPFVLIMHYASALLHMDGGNSERAPPPLMWWVSRSLFILKRPCWNIFCDDTVSSPTASHGVLVKHWSCELGDQTNTARCWPTTSLLPMHTMVNTHTLVYMMYDVLWKNAISVSVSDSYILYKKWSLLCSYLYFKIYIIYSSNAIMILLKKKSSSKKYTHNSDAKFFFKKSVVDMLWHSNSCGWTCCREICSPPTAAWGQGASSTAAGHIKLNYFWKLFPIFFLSWRYSNQNKPAPILFLPVYTTLEGTQCERSSSPGWHLALHWIFLILREWQFWSKKKRGNNHWWFKCVNLLNGFTLSIYFLCFKTNPMSGSA